MNTEVSSLQVGDLHIAVERKAIKNLHLGVYPPDGRVRVAAPLAISDAALETAVLLRLSWIRRQQAAFSRQPREPRREMVSGESHYYLGQRYRLDVQPGEGPERVVLRGRRMELHVRATASTEARRQVLEGWYRERLREEIPPLLARWEEKLGVQAASWGIRKMKTRWGTCTPEARRIWLNLELAKKPPLCVEYVVAHELAHLISRRHDARFRALLDRHLPTWRTLKAELNAGLLADPC